MDGVVGVIGGGQAVFGLIAAVAALLQQHFELGLSEGVAFLLLVLGEVEHVAVVVLAALLLHGLVPAPWPLRVVPEH